MKRKTKKLETTYVNALNKLVDKLFAEAYKQRWTWTEFAEQAGVCESTVCKLGNRVTRVPQLRTCELLAQALGGSLLYKQGKVSGYAAKTLPVKRLYKKDVKHQLRIVA